MDHKTYSDDLQPTQTDKTNEETQPTYPPITPAEAPQPTVAPNPVYTPPAPTTSPPTATLQPSDRPPGITVPRPTEVCDEIYIQPALTEPEPPAPPEQLHSQNPAPPSPAPPQTPATPEQSEPPMPAATRPITAAEPVYIPPAQSTSAPAVPSEPTHAHHIPPVTAIPRPVATPEQHETLAPGPSVVFELNYVSTTTENPQPTATSESTYHYQPTPGAPQTTSSAPENPQATSTAGGSGPSTASPTGHAENKDSKTKEQIKRTLKYLAQNLPDLLYRFYSPRLQILTFELFLFLFLGTSFWHFQTIQNSTLVVFKTAPEPIPEPIPEPVPEPVPPKEPVTINLDTLLLIRLDTPLASKEINSGDSFRGKIIKVNGYPDTLVGNRVYGRVTEIKKAKRLRRLIKGDSMKLTLHSVEIHSQTYPIPTDTRLVEARSKEFIAKVITGTVAGAVIGDAVEDGEGALIGAGLEAGTPLYVQGRRINLEPGEQFVFKLSDNFVIPPPPPRKLRTSRTKNPSRMRLDNRQSSFHKKQPRLKAPEWELTANRFPDLQIPRIGLPWFWASWSIR